MGSFVRSVLIVVVALGLTTGCQMLSWLIGMAAKALPYLIFFAEAEFDPSDPLDPGPADDDAVALALRRALEPDATLPSALLILPIPPADGEDPIEVHGLQVRAGSQSKPYLDLLHRLESRGVFPRVIAVDAGPLLDEPNATERFSLSSADGPLAALVRLDRPSRPGIGPPLPDSD